MPSPPSRSTPTVRNSSRVARRRSRSRCAISARSSTATAARSSGWTPPGSRSARPRSSSSRRATAANPRGRTHPDGSTVGRAVHRLDPPAAQLGRHGRSVDVRGQGPERARSGQPPRRGGDGRLPPVRRARGGPPAGDRRRPVRGEDDAGPGESRKSARRSRSSAWTAPTRSRSTSGRRPCRSPPAKRPPCRSASPPGERSSSAGPTPGRSTCSSGPAAWTRRRSP